MKSTLLILLSLVLNPFAHGMEISTIMISKVMAEPNQDTRPMTLQHEESTETLHVDQNIVISDRDIREATLVEADAPAIRITLTDHGAKKLATLTKESINQRIAIVLDGHLVSAPVVKAEISGGVLQVSGKSLSNPEAVVQAIKDRLAVLETEKAFVITLVGGKPVQADGEVSIKAIQSTLQEIAKTNPSHPIIIRADQGTPYASVAAILDLCKKAGLSNIAIATPQK